MIEFANAGKAFRNRKGEISWVFRNFTATFRRGVSTGILAPRGQGKSTFINIAAGNDTLTEGRVFRRGDISFPFGSREAITNKLSGRQNLRFLTDVYGRNFAAAYRFVDEFSELGRYLDVPMKQYNNEMRGRFVVSALLALDFDFILVDDNMDGGDNSFRKKYIQYLEANRDRFTFLIASGNVTLVQKYCQAAGVLNEGKLMLTSDVGAAIAEFNRVNQVLV